MGEFIIHGSTDNDAMFPADKGRGLVERDYAASPVGSLPGVPAMHAVDMPLVPRSEWSARIKEMEATKSRLSDIRETGNFGQRIPSLDQGQMGYCWAHSTTGAVQIVRAFNNQPYVPLSAYAVAATIKNYRDEGGWAALSLDFVMNRGVPAQKFWPQGSLSRANDNAATWENAALHKVTEGWVDLQAAVYDRELTFDQVITCLLNRQPVAGDFYWWGHSVLVLDPVEVEPGSFGVRILNSWGDGWGANGTAVLQGSKAIPDGAVALRAVSPSVA